MVRNGWMSLGDCNNNVGHVKLSDISHVYSDAFVEWATGDCLDGMQRPTTSSLITFFPAIAMGFGLDACM